MKRHLKLTKRQTDLFNIMKAKLVRTAGRNLTPEEISKLHTSVYINFDDEQADNALKNLSSNILSDSETWDDWMNKNYSQDYEDRKKKASKPKKRITKKKIKSCGCK